MTELKPCPFCNKEAWEVPSRKDKCFCNNDDCVICGILFDSTKWNTRPSLWTTITDEASLPKEGELICVEMDWSKDDNFETPLKEMYFGRLYNNEIIVESTYCDIGSFSFNKVIRWMPIPEDK